jgi:citrate lyase beta subunit
MPQLSAEDSANAQQSAKQSVSIAERNLESVRGKTLNAAQAELASKIRGFLADAEDAMRELDWPRARDLARKAQLLSEQLSGSQ